MNNLAEIRKTLDVFKQGELVELRAIGSPGLSGYFRDMENALKCIAANPNETFYFVMNEINEQCYAKSQREMLQRGAKSATADSDITFRQWVLIDTDPVRATGISATEEEKLAAMHIAQRVHNYLRDVGFAAPILADSGNGWHLLYKVQMLNSAENAEAVKRFLMALDMMFSDDAVKIDTAVYNASRITKLYGTMATKGANTPDRPHRQSAIEMIPDEIQATSIDLFRKVAEAIPEPVKPDYKTGYSVFDIRDFIAKNGIRVARETSYSDGIKLVLENCPFNPEHKAPDSAIFVKSNGALGFKCFHNSCCDKGWKELRELYEPRAQRAYAEQPRSIKPLPAAPTPAKQEGDRFQQLHEISYTDRSQVITIQTGFTMLDKKIIGMNKGEMSVWSGGNGAGKSTMLSQIALTAMNRGFKVAYFSGELSGNRVKEWAQLQAAGRQYTRPSKFDGLYYVPRDYAALIDEWAAGKLWVYNNSYGTSFRQVISSLEQKTVEQGIDMIVIDNLMCLDLRDVSGDKWEKQTEVSLALSEFAKRHKVHIHFVCHPRKPMGFLRKTDISGTADLTNIADNVFMAHRVNTDFNNNAPSCIGKERAGALSAYSNVIECMKNRDLGIEDHMVGLYFEQQSKRFLNERFENPNYGWVEKLPPRSWVNEVDDAIANGDVTDF